jgi:ditrans,polycis-polyprenyl diphosphate synthase
MPLDRTLITCPPKMTTTTTNHPHRGITQIQTHSRYSSRFVTKRVTIAAAFQDQVDGETSVDEDFSEMEPLPEELQAELMPKHVAVIMDGNGRWAKMRGLPPSAGHVAGVKSLRRMVRLCYSWGIKVLTVFAFSTDNWIRPKVILISLVSLVNFD